MAKRVWFSLDNMFEETVSDEVATDEGRLRDYLVSQLEYHIQSLGKSNCEIHIDDIADEEEKEE